MVMNGEPHLSEIHRLANLIGVHLADRAAGNGKILRRHKHLPAINAAAAGNDPLAGHLFIGHAEGGAAMAGKEVEFLKGIVIDQQV